MQQCRAVLRVAMGWLEHVVHARVKLGVVDIVCHSVKLLGNLVCVHLEFRQHILFLLLQFVDLAFVKIVGIVIVPAVKLAVRVHGLAVVRIVHLHLRHGIRVARLRCIPFKVEVVDLHGFSIGCSLLVRLELRDNVLAILLVQGLGLGELVTL